MGVLDWGDVPTWIGGAGAIAAGWFAFQTITSQRQQIGEQREFIAEQTRFMEEQRRNLQLERAELSAAAEERRWAQAKLIKMVPRYSRNLRQMARDAEPEDQWIVGVNNKSDAPVHDVDVLFGLRHAETVHVLANHPDDTDLPQSRPLPVLGAGRVARFRSAHPLSFNLKPRLFFTDSDGHRWSLDYYGVLTEAPSNGDGGC